MSKFQVLLSISTKTGVALNFNTAFKHEIIVKFGIIISSFSFIPIPNKAVSKAAVPLETVKPYLQPMNFENHFQKGYYTCRKMKYFQH